MPFVSVAPDEPVLAVDEIQGNVMPGFNTRHLVLMGVSFGTPEIELARRWLGTLVASVATLGQVNRFRVQRRAAGEPPPDSRAWVNVAFDSKGLALLAADASRIRDPRFRQGMGVDSVLGDPTDPAHEGHPERWVVGGTPERTPEALVLVAGDDLEAVRERAAAVRSSAEAAGLRVPYEQDGHQLEGDVEHFGFRDGISSPGARGRLSGADGDFLTRRIIDPSDDRSSRFGRPGQPLLWPGQFVFGYARQRDDDPVLPGPIANGGHDWMVNGSYLVFRRLRQDVAAFRRFVADESARLRGVGLASLTAERLAALLVGRWPGGTALMRNPSGDDPDPTADRLAVNHFGYGEAAAPVEVRSEDGDDVRTVSGAMADRLGRICPGFAHVRKVNPRDLPTDKGGPDRTLTFAVLRRGIPWGPVFPSDPAGSAGDDGQRGLLFLCYQTSIKDQFETLNSDWMNRVNGPEGGTGHDLLVGQGSGATRQRTANLPAAGGATPIATLAEWVIPTGGGYYFSPSLSALRQFAAGGA